MNVEKTYQKIVNEINLGHRALVRFSQDELAFLPEKLLRSFERQDFEELEKLLCIVEHSGALSGKFEKTLIQILSGKVPDRHLIFALNCARKHIVEARFQRGQRLEFDFLETLKRLLFHKNPEVVEWTLRLIEGSGNQGVYFLREFDKIKPPPWKWFNEHQRAVREIIALLERRWSPRETKPRS
jgi:hypothetical protein